MKLFGSYDGNRVGVHPCGILAVNAHGVSIPVALDPDQAREVGRTLLNGGITPRSARDGEMYVLNPPPGADMLSGPYVGVRTDGGVYQKPWTVWSASRHLDDRIEGHDDSEVSLMGRVNLALARTNDAPDTPPPGGVYLVEVPSRVGELGEGPLVGFRNDPTSPEPWEVVDPSRALSVSASDSQVVVKGRVTTI